VIGQTISTSGFVGASIGNQRNGLAIWVQAVNARGGVQCHPIKLIALDDGADPARVSANVTRLIDNDKAVAIVGAGVPITPTALRSVVEQKKVAAVGGDVITADWNESPYMFPQGSAAVLTHYGSTLEAARAKPGATKAGLLYCVEAGACTAIKASFPAGTKLAGLTPVVERAVSVTQTSYTAECQVLKDAGVEVLFLSVDGASAQRVARSCASLGYRPAIATLALAINATSSADANLRAFGVYLGAALAPFTESSTPGLKQFQQDVANYGGGQNIDQSTLTGYASGLLFEAALGKVADRARSAPVTAAMVLDGLHLLKNEKLGGISAGVTFKEGAPAQSAKCYFALAIRERGFYAPRGSTPQCL
jgi:branched-chain amino acid transport system substrate-binding protein